MKVIMKKLFVILILTVNFYFVNLTKSQVPSDFPFKTTIDNEGYLFVTGTSSAHRLLVQKFSLNGSNEPIWSKEFENPYGNDKGMDIQVDSQFPNNVIVTGYVFDNKFEKNKAIILNLNRESGNMNWSRIIPINNSSEGLGIYINQEQDIFICGYAQGRTGKDFLAAKYDIDGNFQWLKTLDNTNYRGDDVATDILVDGGFVYLMGHTFNGSVTQQDLMMVTYTKEGNFVSKSIYPKKGNEYPTGFVFSMLSLDSRNKSRTSSTGFTDNATYHNTRDFITITFDDDSLSSVKWINTFNNSISNDNDIPTAITSYKKGTGSSVFVTGYSKNSVSGYDFTTIKYDGITGEQQWVKYFDYPSAVHGDDRASSILVRNDSLLISGSCAMSPNGFATIKYPLTGNNPPGIESWSNTFIPSFLTGRNPDDYYSSSILHPDATGNIVAVFMGWNESFQNFAAQTYDPMGNVLHTLDPDIKNSISFKGFDFNKMNRIISRQNDESNTSVSLLQFDLKQNFPNPFNPVTKINYTLRTEAFISLKVYDVSGKEIASIIDNYRNPGSYSIYWDASGYSSGVYYYKLTANGIAVETKRMLLIK